ncbi:putative histone-lysine N-methyltransferase PRDM6 [Cervus elaphus]|uniref:putative histone-lysine N-methyltransferase PRDM6 n=1 Tax=Cervus elaphus TaxID=9860 RepID=UPI001CC2B26A|nr:putative histone-lysine N-methyltransferase PRDM6 [Cervus elaphus]
MPGIREVASEAGGEDVTRALRRPCSGVPRGEAARVARRPLPALQRTVPTASPPPPAPPPPGHGGPTPRCAPERAPTSGSAGWAGRAAGGAAPAFFGRLLALGADLPAGARLAAAAAA